MTTKTTKRKAKAKYVATPAQKAEAYALRTELTRSVERLANELVLDPEQLADLQSHESVAHPNSASYGFVGSWLQAVVQAQSLSQEGCDGTFYLGSVLR